MLFVPNKGRMDGGLCLDPPICAPLSHLIKRDDRALLEIVEHDAKVVLDTP